MIEKFVETKFGKINYLETGEGKQTLVFFHGCFQITDGLRKESFYLVPQGYKTISPSLPLHGLSFTPKEDFSFPNMVETMTEFVKKVATEKGVTLVGQSFGGAVALETAKRTKCVNKLILDAPLLTPIEGTMLTVATKFLARGAKDYLAGIFSQKNSLNKEKNNSRIVRWPHYNKALVLWEILKTIKIGDIGTIAVPMLALFGKDDSVIGVEKQLKVLDKFPKADILFFPGGHGWFYRRPLTRLKIIDDFSQHGRLTQSYGDLERKIASRSLSRPRRGSQ